MMQMMQQMMSGMPPGLGPNAGLPQGGMPDLATMMQQMMSGQGKTAEVSAQPVSDRAYMWRIVHALFAFSLAVWVGFTTPFTGSRLARFVPVDAGAQQGANIFFVFAAVEAVLQSSRYFLEKGQLQGGGWLATIANSGMIPEPWVGYIRVAGRYLTIWNTIVGDAMMIVFVLGGIAWWRGTAAVV